MNLIFFFHFIFIYFNLMNCSSSFYNNIRIKSEENCLIQRNNNNNNNKKHDLRTTLNTNKNCILFYIHFHKSGGTTICSMAIHEGYKSNRDTNCQTNILNRNNEYKYSIENNYTFIAQEGGYFQPNISSNQIIYFTTIRNPYDRIISHLHHEFCERKRIDAIDLTKNRYQCDFDITTVTLTDIILSDCFNTTLKYFTSNFYLKILTDCHDYNCNLQHLEEAKDKLHLMTVVMITDTSADFNKYINYIIYYILYFTL